MTFGLKLMVLTIFLSVLGLFLGVAGLIAGWSWARGIGLVSAIVLAIVFWLEPSDRFLFGSKKED
ncbi:hypothetical protein SAMN05892877_11053 [Rhizobium subbaraonis]|uniref:Major facilitator superfamily (MFS) profile domain-containing protein n=1 Tax=Rhizobium subbaraonis TaxID=908946 RepID=A0A285UL41_9HYPH|nr:hypothetical protein [Rhizobium subbaraonis]SOC42532.1 hypothetical protein SAMN05892877_11053 [Rhizobium subbaraonis]